MNYKRIGIYWKGMTVAEIPQKRTNGEPAKKLFMISVMGNLKPMGIPIELLMADYGIEATVRKKRSIMLDNDEDHSSIKDAMVTVPYYHGHADHGKNNLLIPFRNLTWQIRGKLVVITQLILVPVPAEEGGKKITFLILLDTRPLHLCRGLLILLS